MLNQRPTRTAEIVRECVKVSSSCHRDCVSNTDAMLLPTNGLLQLLTYLTLYNHLRYRTVSREVMLIFMQTALSCTIESSLQKAPR